MSPDGIGLNDGVLDLSPFRVGQPTLICGLGRGGTTAMARCFAVSANARVVTDDASPESTLEAHAVNRACREGNGEWLSRFRTRTSVEYDPEFVIKSPVFEVRSRAKPGLREAWSGANLLIMSRDPVCLSLREASLGTSGAKAGDFLIQSIQRLHTGLLSALEMAASMGVLIVSYEKLVVVPERVAGKVNAWWGRDVLCAKRCAECIRPNNPSYIARQSRDLAKRG